MNAFSKAGKLALKDGSGTDTEHEQERRVGLDNKQSVSAKMKAEKKAKQLKKAESRAEMRSAGKSEKSGSGTDTEGAPSSPGAGDPGIRDKVL